jgi:predicted site-specific integrase-resolvase
MVTDLQVRRLFDMRNKHKHLYQAADAAGISRKTARKYLKRGKLPSQWRVEQLGRHGRIRFPMTGLLSSIFWKRPRRH